MHNITNMLKASEFIMVHISFYVYFIFVNYQTMPIGVDNSGRTRHTLNLRNKDMVFEFICHRQHDMFVKYVCPSGDKLGKAILAQS